MQQPQSKGYHNILSPVKSLPPHIELAIHQTYSKTEGRQFRERLAQGEIDVLEPCAKALGWKTVTSLATKYYPLLPERHCWRRALALALRYRPRWYTQTLPIRYLLKAVIQQWQESLERNFSGKLSDIQNRLPTIDSTIGETILNGKGVWGKTDNPLASDPDKYIKGRYAHMVMR